MSHLNVKRLGQLLDNMKMEKAGYMQIYGATQELNRTPSRSGRGIYYKKRDEKWRGSLQPAFWNKVVFENLLDSKEKNWDFEVKGSIRSQANLHPFLVVTHDLPLDYLNMTLLGKRDDGNLEKIKALYGIEWKRKLPLYSRSSFKRFWNIKVAPFFHKIKASFSTSLAKLSH